MKWYMNLHLFEGGAGAGAAPAAGGEGGGEAAVTPGVLEDGTQVDDRLAARMEEQARKRKARGDVPAKQPQAQQPQQQEQPKQEPQEPSLEDQWNEARNGKFKDLYGRDVQNASATGSRTRRIWDSSWKRWNPCCKFSGTGQASKTTTTW